MNALLVSSLLSFQAAAAHVKSVEADSHGTSGKGIVVGIVDAPMDDVAALIQDCERMGEWFPDILETTEVAGGSGTPLCRGTTDVPWPLEDRVWTVESSHRQAAGGWEVYEFRYLPGSGNLTEMDGRYWLREGAGGTEVRYEVTIDLGIWVPSPIVGWATQRWLPGIVHGLGSVLNGEA